MRSLLLFCALCGLTLTLSAQAVTDTLEANVGAKARVLFLAKSAADFTELSKYDLNALYAELYRREFGTDKQAMRLFDNEEAGLLQKRPGRNGFSLRLGFFAGRPVSRTFDTRVFENLTLPELGERPVRTSTIKQGKVTGRGSLGINLGIEKALISKDKFLLNLNASVGFEWTGYKVKRPSSTIASPEVVIVDSVSVGWPNGETYNQYLFDTVGWNSYRLTQPLLQGTFSHLFLELLPTIQFLRNNGKRGFKVGLGARFGPDLSQNELLQFRQFGVNYIDVGQEGALYDELAVEKYYADWHLTWLAVVGYGKFNLQLSYIPKAVINIQSYYVTNGFRENLGWNDSGLFNIGIRYGL